MLDIQFIRDNYKKIKKAAQDKGVDDKPINKVLELDKKRRELIQNVEKLRKERNTLTKDSRKRGKEIKEKLKKLEPELREIEIKYKEVMLKIPNIPSKDTPIGKNEEDNKLIREWGKKPKFDFKIKNHVQLGKSLDLLDLERGSKISGFRGYFLKNDAVLMQWGLMQYALNKLIKKGFTPIIPPTIVNKRSLINTGHFPWGAVDIYKTFNDTGKKDEKFLTGTSEVPLISFHQNETLLEKDLPLKYVGLSSCYRREIGNYGKDTHGVYRVHEFFKIEQVVICKNDMKTSLKWHEKLANYSEEILQELKLPYRIMMMCTGDMGEPQVRKYDIETWMPGRNKYCETMSDSIMGEFQARRANIKYRTGKNENKYVHTLNNTAVASPRILIAIWENYQQKDGSIKIPDILQKYIGKERIKKHV